MQSSNTQIESVKSLIKEHLEQNKFIENIKSAVARDTTLASLDRNTIIDNLNSEKIYFLIVEISYFAVPFNLIR